MFPLSHAAAMFQDVLGPPRTTGPGWLQWLCRVGQKPAVITLRDRPPFCVALFDKPWPDEGDLAHIGFLEITGERAAVWLLRHLVQSDTCAGRTSSRWPRGAAAHPQTEVA